MAKFIDSKHDLGNGYRGYVTATRAQVYQGATFLGQTDHAGRVTQVKPGVERSVVETQGAALLARAGVVVRTSTAVPTQAPTPAAVRARNWRCPNPRDCGDPTCDGNCGY